MDALRLMIEELEREIENDRQSLALKEKMVANWKAKYLHQQHITKTVTPTLSRAQDVIEQQMSLDLLASEDGMIDPDLLLDDEPRRPTMLDDIKDIIERFGYKEFTVQHVDKIYKAQNGIAADDNSNRSRISTALGRLKDSGYLEMTLKGGGNVPNKYRRTKDQEAHELD